MSVLLAQIALTSIGWWVLIAVLALLTLVVVVSFLFFQLALRASNTVDSEVDEREYKTQGG